MKNIVVSCVVSKRIYTEFTYLKYSIEKYHNVKWILSVDSYVYDKYKTDNNIELHLLIDKSGTFRPIDVQDYDEIKESKSNYRKLINTKMDILKISIEKYGYGLLLDADMVFVSPLDDRFIYNLINKKYDIFVSRHNDALNDALNDEIIYGKYNAGMVGVTNIELLHEWIELTNSRKYYFYEQKPLDDIIDSGKYSMSELDIGMNVAFWKISNITDLTINNEYIYIKDKRVVNFHYHFDERVAIHGYDDQHYILELLKYIDYDTYIKIIKEGL